MSSRWILVFAVAFAVFFIGPAMLGFPFPLYSLMKAGDAFDLLTPLILIPLYWRLFLDASDRPTTGPPTTAFLVLASLWVLGQGMHLSANSIGHQLKTLQATPAYVLTDFYDETLSHYLWHLGVFGLAALLAVRAAYAEARLPAPGGVIWPAAAVYGLTFAIIVLEGQTWPVGLPFAALASLFPLLTRRTELARRPILGFFTWAHLIALVLMVAWWLYWGTMIEPCDVIGC